MKLSGWDYWWSLPGPYKFVRSIAEDLRRGINVIVALPRWFPIGLERAVRNELSDDDLLSWRPLDLADEDSKPPLEILPGRYVYGITIDDLYDGADLAHCNKFIDTLLWITGVTDGSFPTWKSLIEKYADAVRSYPIDQRGLFCLVAVGVKPSELPREDVALSVKKWQGAVSELDMLAWLHHLMGNKQTRNIIEHRLIMRLALEIAGYDPVLAEDMAKLDLEHLADPIKWLPVVTKNRGWSEDTEPVWEEGSCDIMEGKEIVHSALLSSVSKGKKEIDRFLWRAQVGVLFPLLEEERRAYLEEYASQLRVPIRTERAVIQDREDLELGHIYYQLRNRIGRSERERLRMLRDVRNALAHYDVLSYEKLCNLLRLE